MRKQLVIKSQNNNGWEFVFRKQQGRPIEFLKRHNTLGQLSGYQVARNFCLKGLISREELAEYFGMSEYQFNAKV
jgi:hypothetical protein